MGFLAKLMETHSNSGTDYNKFTLLSSDESADVTIADYIVEQGTSGNWTYRKWNSGIAECWGTFVQSSASFTATGNIYYRNPGGHYFPFAFIETPVVQASVEMGNVGGCMVIATATSATVYTISAVAQARAITERIYAIGRWK